VFAKVFARAVEASFHCGNAGIEGLGNFGVTAAFLHEGEERAVLRAELGERVAEGIELLGVDGAGGLGNIFVLVAEREEDPAQLLAAQLVDAGVAGEAEEPGLKLRRRLQTIQRADHLDEDLLGQILDVIAASGHGVNETGDTVLISDNELALGVFVALLSPADEVGQCGRFSLIHAVGIGVCSKTAERPERFGARAILAIGATFA
jgi:hypothetical protein